MTKGPDLDHLIVGAGVVGCSTAYHLKRLDPDSRVMLIDREKRVGASNTAKSAALYRNIFSSPTSRALARSTIEYFLEHEEELQIRPKGYLWMFSQDQWNASGSALDELDRERDRFKVLSGLQISKMLKVERMGEGPFPSIYKGIHAELCGSLSGMSVAQHYADMFKELGGEVRTAFEVSDIVLGNRKYDHAPWAEGGVSHLSDDKGERMEASNYIFAVGAWTQELLGPIGIYTGVLPKKRQLFGIKVDDPGHIAGHLDPGSVPILILPAAGTYIKPLLDRGLMLVGLAEELGQRFDMNDPDEDVEYFEKAIAPVLSHYFPLLEDHDLRLKWHGYYAYHWPDKNPVVERVENIYWSSGTSGSGIMKADALGRITASKILNEPYSELFGGQRFQVSKLSLRARDVEPERFVI